MEHFTEHVGRRSAADRVLHAHRSYILGALTVFDLLLAAVDHRRGVFGGWSRHVIRLRLARCAHRDSRGRQRSTGLEHFPTAVFGFRIHMTLLRM